MNLSPAINSIRWLRSTRARLPRLSLRRLRMPLTLLALALLALAFAAVRYFPYWPLYGYRGPLPELASEERRIASRLKDHVVSIASRPRNTRYPEALEAAAVYIERQLGEIGYTVERQVYIVDGQRVRNIHVAIGTGGPDRPTFVVGAHYDSWTISPGANDNGSGTAALLELARLLKSYQPARHLLRLVFFVNEEMPHFGTDDWGSRRFAQWLAGREKVSGMISLETIGAYFDQPGTQSFPVPLNLVYRNTGDFITFVGMPRGRTLVHRALGSFRRHTQFPSIGGVAHSFIRGIAWSDHAAFEEIGVPALMITDTALFRYADYHRTTDTADKLDYDRMARLTKGIERMLREIVD